MVQICLNMLNFSPAREGGVPLAEQLDAAAGAGAELIGLDARTVKHFLREGHSVEQLSNEVARRDLRCYELTYLECTTKNRAGTLGAAERMADWAEALGAGYVLTSCPTPIEEPSLELFGECCDVMARAGCGLGYEFFPWAPINTFWLAEEFVRQAGRANAGVTLDNWHFSHGPDDWPQLEAVPVDAIAYVQFSDTKPVAPENYAREAQTCRRFPGDGYLDLRRFARTLLGQGYDGVVSIEVLSPDTRSVGPREFARRCLTTTRSYWA